MTIRNRATRQARSRSARGQALRYCGRLLQATFYGVVGFSGFSVLVLVGLSRSRPEHAAIIIIIIIVVLAVLFWNMAIGYLGALNAMLLGNLVPIVTFAIRILQGHRFETIELVGAGLAVAALIANNLYLRGRIVPHAS